ncbi:MAG TPA: elongation factor 4 [Dehalococcoidia bacterium]|nr:elongation factor 4 [Dehalococcoidia bacterium]
MKQNLIRNFSIIAHIDPGKSTLADRLIELTNSIDSKDMREQVLDSMDLEREKGITIKAQAVRMNYIAPDSTTYELNLIDTPGHVDFSYEVSRALAACEGALLVVDATQGIEAQTLANVYLALELDLDLIPVINKIDMPGAEPKQVAQELANVIGFGLEEMVFVSAKTGEGIDRLLEVIVDRIPAPQGDINGPCRALIFDATYDAYKGVLAYVRVMEGTVLPRQKLHFMVQNSSFDSVEVGYFEPMLKKADSLIAGQVGYIATGLKGVAEARVGDTLTVEANPASEPLSGYEPAKPMVYAGIYPSDSEDYPALREALERLTLNDAALQWQPETSDALGFGFRCGFLGLLHREIVQERLEREFDLDLIATAPSVEYEVTLRTNEEILVGSPAKLPTPDRIAEIREPWAKVSITMPARYIGTVASLVSEHRGEFGEIEYIDRQDGSVDLDSSRVLANYSLPLAEMLVDFFDTLKSRTQGYASMDYDITGYEPASVSRLDVLVNGELVDALSMIVPADSVAEQGRKLAKALKEEIPRHMFEVPVQAVVGGKIVARETVKAMRKNVLAKCYGGDVSRKRKLLEAQKAGKKRMKVLGNVEVPQDAFLAMMKNRG